MTGEETPTEEWQRMLEELSVEAGGHLGPSEAEFMALTSEDSDGWLVMHKPSPEARIMQRQMHLYAEALHPWGISKAVQDAERAMLATYSRADAAFTMTWWQKYGASGSTVLINKLRPSRGLAKEIWELNDLIHPDTIRRMTRPIR